VLIGTKNQRELIAIPVVEVVDTYPQSKATPTPLRERLLNFPVDF
jgi:hypothetical protein